MKRLLSTLCGESKQFLDDTDDDMRSRVQVRFFTWNLESGTAGRHQKAQSVTKLCLLATLFAVFHSKQTETADRTSSLLKDSHLQRVGLKLACLTLRLTPTFLEPC